MTTEKIKNYYKNFIVNNFQEYWSIYGGLKSFFKSPFLHFSLLISLVIFPFRAPNFIWYDIVLIVLPNLLGFTIAGIAILVAFGDRKFLFLIAGKKPDSENKASPYMKTSSTFLHFIIVQILTLLYGISFKALEIQSGIFGWLGFMLLIYALCTGISAACSIFHLSNAYDIWIYKQKKNGKHSNTE